MRSAESARTWVRVRLRTFCHGFLTLCLAMVVATAALTSGSSYRWCVPMQRAMSSCCCAATEDPSEVGPAERASTLQRSCCDSRASDVLPQVQRAHDTPTEVPPPAFAAVPEASAPHQPIQVISLDRAALPAFTARYGPSRAGPRSAVETCSLLQVFRC